MNWPKKWSKPTLVKVKKLWERYREEVVPLPTIIPFSYDNPSREVRELDVMNSINSRAVTHQRERNPVQLAVLY